MAEDLDPFAGSTKREAVSWKNAAVGATVYGSIVEVPKLIQARDYDTGKPVFWDPVDKGQKTTTPNDQPAQTVVIVLSIDGEEKSLWAAKPSALFTAFGEAQKRLGRLSQVGDVVSVKFTGEKVSNDPVKAKKNFPQKLYAVKIEAGQADAFGEEEPPF